MDYERPGFEIEAGFGGAIAMLLVPEDMASLIREWGMNHIDDGEVYGKDGKGRDGSPHITLQNGIMCEDGEELEKLFSRLPAMEATLGPVGIFSNDEKDYDVVHITVLSDELHEANSMIADLLNVDNPHMNDYSPHITLAYVNKGAGKRFDGLKDFVGKKIQLGRLAIDGPKVGPKMLDLAPRVVPDGKRDDKMSEADFNPKVLADAAKQELANTKNITLAKEIAMDRLNEDPDHYKRLKEVEAKKKRCSHTKGGYWCGRCEPLKESLDYGASKKAYLAEDVEDYLLSSGRSVGSLAPGELESIIAILRSDPSRINS